MVFMVTFPVTMVTGSVTDCGGTIAGEEMTIIEHISTKRLLTYADLYI